MRIFVCRICSQVYLGETIPHSCPFCGVSNKYFRMAQIWQDENNVELSDISKKNLEEALRIELSNTAFYECAAENLSNTETAMMFRGLAAVEQEHANVFQTLLNIDELPEIAETCVDDVEKCLEESLNREKKAVAFYAKAMQEAIEPRIKEVFEAIMNTEKDHIALDNEMKDKVLNN